VGSVHGPWDRIVLTAIIESDWSNFRSSVIGSDGSKRPLLIRDASGLTRLFEDVQRITTEIGGARWKTARFTLHRSGEFETDFDY
jgi:hypothetical protein